jgi:hypothetical protein
MINYVTNHCKKDYLRRVEDTKGVIRFLYPRRTDKTMAKRKSTKGQTTIYKTLHIKLKIE